MTAAGRSGTSLEVVEDVFGPDEITSAIRGAFPAALERCTVPMNDRKARRIWLRGYAAAIAAGSAYADAAAASGSDEADPTRRAEDVDPYPTIATRHRALADVSADALASLVAANDPPHLFVRGGNVVRVVYDESGSPAPQLMNEAALRGRLARTAHYVDAPGGHPCPPPRDVVQDILGLASWPLPALRSIVEAPVLRPDGSLLETPGYDEATGLLLLPDPQLGMPSVPVAPSPQQLEGAVKLLADELLGDFPFVSPADRTNMLGLLLTPIVRPVIAGLVPLALLDKPQAGTGASLLAELVARISTGRPAAMLAAPTDPAEWRKAITAILLEAPAIIILDNIDARLRSPYLAQALTAEAWRDRLLGASETVLVPQCATWIATGNNLRLGGDLARRSYVVRLDAQHPRPWLRDGFRHPNLLDWVHAQRGPVLGGLLTLARHWFAEGCPAGHSPELGNFGAWARTVGGILAAAGITDFLGNLQRHYDDIDEEASEWDAFLAAWHAQYRERPLTVAALVEDLRANPAAPLRATLPAVLTEAIDKPAFATRLGTALRGRRDRVHADQLRLEQPGTDAHAKTKTWRVRCLKAGRAADSAGSAESPPSPSMSRTRACGSDDNTLRNSPHPPQATPPIDLDAEVIG